MVQIVKVVYVLCIFLLTALCTDVRLFLGFMYFSLIVSCANVRLLLGCIYCQIVAVDSLLRGQW